MNTTPTNRSKAQAGLAHIDAWVFDLDNTLYPAQCDLFAQVDRRMGEFISALLDIDRTAARRIQKTYYYQYGTTLRGLMTCHDVRPDDFLDYVHEIDVTKVPRDPALNAAIGALPGRKFIFTNGSASHARRVIRQIGIEDLFEDIFDIARAGYLPKPDPATYDRFVEAAAIDPATSIMFEDLARNLKAASRLGMTTVLVRGGDAVPDHVHDIEGPGDDEPHVHYVTDDLTGFLNRAAASG